MDGHLTNIMMAQDFRDLTGRSDRQGGGPGGRHRGTDGPAAGRGSACETSAGWAKLSGPVVNPDGRTDVVSSQGEVDDLLASLGF